MEKTIKNIDPKPICRRLKSVRKALNFNSASGFAKYLGINITTYSNYEKHRLPPSDVLFEIANKFPRRVDIEWILTGEEPSCPDSDAHETEHAGRISTETLEGVIKGVEDYLRDAKKTLVPEIKAKLITLLYDHFTQTDAAPNQKTIVSYLKLVA